MRGTNLDGTKYVAENIPWLPTSPVRSRSTARLARFVRLEWAGRVAWLRQHALDAAQFIYNWAPMGTVVVSHYRGSTPVRCSRRGERGAELDYRIEPPQLTPREQWREYRRQVGRHVISMAGLWPTADYAAPRPRQGPDRRCRWRGRPSPVGTRLRCCLGVGAAAGLITAVVAGINAAVFGGSLPAGLRPDRCHTVVLLPVIAQFGIGSVPLLAILAGAIVVGMALTGVGKAVEFVPIPVVEGFTMGIGVIIALQQIPLVLGTERVDASSTLVSGWLTMQATDWSRAWQPILVVLAVIGLHILGLRKYPKWPISLITIAIATVAAELLPTDLDRIGALPTGLPAPQLPPLSIGLIQELAAPALAVAALAALESLLSARVADGMRPDIPDTHPDRELMGQGLANIASGLFGGLPATGAIARTAVNVRSGARTRVSAVSHSLCLLAVMLLLAPLVSRIPMAALGGVLLVTAGRMISLGTARVP